MESLLADAEWERLAELAERLVELADADGAAEAKRYLALCLARSSEEYELERAIVLYQDLAMSPQAKAEDWAGVATLLTNTGRYDAATVAVRQGAAAFPGKVGGFVELGMRIVSMTGNSALRDEVRSWQTEVQRK